MLKRWPITSVIFAAGWLLVVAAVIARPQKEQAWLALFFVMTLFVVWRRDLPKRSQALMGSWIGPLILAVGPLLQKTLYAPIFHTDLPALPTLRAVQSAAGIQIAAMWLLSGCHLAILMVWLFRLYGIIPVFVIMATGWPARFKNLDHAMEQYPPRWWWAVPLGAVALHGAMGMGAYLWLRSLPT